MVPYVSSVKLVRCENKKIIIPHLTSFSKIVEKLVIANNYDARTYGPIILKE